MKQPIKVLDQEKVQTREFLVGKQMEHNLPTQMNNKEMIHKQDTGDFNMLSLPSLHLLKGTYAYTSL